VALLWLCRWQFLRLQPLTVPAINGQGFFLQPTRLLVFRWERRGPGQQNEDEGKRGQEGARTREREPGQTRPGRGKDQRAKGPGRGKPRPYNGKEVVYFVYTIFGWAKYVQYVKNMRQIAIKMIANFFAEFLDVMRSMSP
jgi:hypothetical protein